MNIGLIAHDSKKKLMQNFCIAYHGILSKNQLYATGTTGQLIKEVTNLSVHKFLAGHLGGVHDAHRGAFHSDGALLGSARVVAQASVRVGLGHGHGADGQEHRQAKQPCKKTVFHEASSLYKYEIDENTGQCARLANPVSSCYNAL